MHATVRSVLYNWRVWGIPALIELFAPWHNRITGLSLISNYWQPHLNLFCSAMGALAAMFAFAMLRGQTAKVWRAWAWRLALLFVLTFLIVLALNFTGDRFLPSGEILLRLTWFLWIVAYIAIFVGSSGLMVVLLLLINGPKVNPTDPKSLSGRSPKRVE